MRDTLPFTPLENESGIVNFNSSKQSGCHWVCYFKRGMKEFILTHLDKLLSMNFRNILKNLQKEISK